MITVVIATRNDKLLPQTLASLRQGFEGQIIIVDDCSDMPVVNDLLSPIWRNTTIWRNKNRLGPGPSRHIGASMAPDDWVMFCDSHMTFPENWHNIAYEWLTLSEEIDIWGATYRQHKIDNSFWHDTRLIGGADFYWWRHHDLRFTFVDLLPRRIQNRPEYEVPCLLGGCYFVHTDWFHKMGGFSMFTGYGSEEPWLSWNTHLRGGLVRVMGNLQVTHIFQKGTGLKRSMIPEWEMNRLMVAKRVLTHDQYMQFCSWLPISQTTKDQIELVASAQPHIFNREFDKLRHEDVLAAFSLQSFDEVIELMQIYDKDTMNLCSSCKDRRWLINGMKLEPCPRCNRISRMLPNINQFTLEPTGYE